MLDRIFPLWKDNLWYRLGGRQSLFPRIPLNPLFLVSHSIPSRVPRIPLNPLFLVLIGRNGRFLYTGRLMHLIYRQWCPSARPPVRSSVVALKRSWKTRPNPIRSYSTSEHIMFSKPTHNLLRTYWKAQKILRIFSRQSKPNSHCPVGVGNPPNNRWKSCFKEFKLKLLLSWLSAGYKSNIIMQ